MGLISAALGSVGGVLAEQWKEYFYCEALPETVLVTKGKKRIGKRGTNTKGEKVSTVKDAVVSSMARVSCDASPSYTWNTLKHLSEDYPQNDFILLMGGDNWKRFERWWHWKDIIWQYETGIFPRNGEIPVSSTMIREMLAKGEDISPYVPKTVVRHYQTSCLP